MSDIESVADQRTTTPRDTIKCPNCSGTVREPRSGDKWICDGCARYWDAAELPEVDA